jgi:tetratricopeptide (TPR) repeat protein
MAKAFLSHSSINKELAAKIAEQLGQNNCLIDVLAFEAGRLTLDEILDKLEDTDVFVLLLSNEALESPWVKKEIREAKKRLDKNVISRIFPLIIDNRILYSDLRIPAWIRKPYNIRFFDNEVLLLKKIQQILREVNLKKFSHLRDQETLFIGRHESLSKAMQTMYNVDNKKPTCLIAHNFVEGIGRRTFLKNALRRTGITDEWYEPIVIPMGSKESIEDFIYKLNFITPSRESYGVDLSEIGITEKVDMVLKTISTFNQNGEIVFIIDEGSIVLPNTQIAEWFLDLIKRSELQNHVSICLVAKFKPDGRLIRNIRNTFSFQISELNPADTTTLFIQYLDRYEINLKREENEYFLKYLKGIPTQIIYTANLIAETGVENTKRNIKEVEGFDEIRAISVLDHLKGQNEQLAIDILCALARVDIFSNQLIFKIFGDQDETYKALQKLFDLGIIFPVSSTHEYLKLNSSISDYINRAKMDMSDIYQIRLSNFIKDSLSVELQLNVESDYSTFLLTLREMIKQKIKVPKKYLLPSFILKSVVQEYYDKNYRTCVNLCKKVLENESRYDGQILRETRYWLCLSYCRQADEKSESEFYEQLNYFRSEPGSNLKDYYFLLGFYNRNLDRMDKAEEYYKKVLEIDERHSRTKRELVNVYLRTGQYSTALILARENYYQFRSNILHVQAYFTCLIKKHNLNDNDIGELHNLVDETSKSLDKRSSEIVNTMDAELMYYIESDLEGAIAKLEENLRLATHKYYPFKALSEIYRQMDMSDALQRLQTRFPNYLKSSLEEE